MVGGYQPPSLLAACRLGPGAPLGLFKPLDRNDHDELLWVVEREERRFAVFIQAHPNWVFEALVLNDDTEGWNGINLGPVELLLGTDVVGFQETMRTQLGAMTLGNGAVMLGARSREGTPVRFEVARCAPYPGQVSALFLNWQLVQRDHAGKPIVLFEKTQ